MFDTPRKSCSIYLSVMFLFTKQTSATNAVAGFISRRTVARSAPSLQQRYHSLSTTAVFSKIPNRKKAYSVDEIRSQRPVPPVLDSLAEEEGFGAYDYVPDAYEQQNWQRQEEMIYGLHENDAVDYYDYETSTKSATKASATSNRKAAALAKSAEDLVAAAESMSKHKKSIPLKSAEDLVATEAPKRKSTRKQKVTRTNDQTSAPSPSFFPSMEEPVKSPPAYYPDENFSSRKRPDAFISTKTTSYTPPSLDELLAELETVKQDIYQQNNGVEFNINSYEQVAKIIFGDSTMSTNKNVLDAKAAAGDRMSALVLKYRSISAQIKKIQKKTEAVVNKTAVTKLLSVARGSPTDPQIDNTADPLALIDASAYIFRAYHAMPPIHRASDGMPTGAVMGFCSMLNRLILNSLISNREAGGENDDDDQDDDDDSVLQLPPRLVLVFDSGGKNFRHQLYPQYKGHRPEAPVDLVPQFALVRAAAEAYGIARIEAPNFEADDVIATLTTMAVAEGLDVNIYSADKDLMQLVSEQQNEPPCVQMIDPMRFTRVTHQQVMDKFFVPPSLVGDALALIGDASDNVPGVPKIGPKNAAQLLDQYGTLNGILENVDSISKASLRTSLQENIDQARLSRQLVELERKIPLDQMTLPTGMKRVSELRMEPFDPDRVLAFYDEMKFFELKRKLLSLLEGRKFKRTARRKNSNKREKAGIPRPEDYADVPF